MTLPSSLHRFRNERLPILTPYLPQTQPYSIPIYPITHSSPNNPQSLTSKLPLTRSKTPFPSAINSSPLFPACPSSSTIPQGTFTVTTKSVCTLSNLTSKTKIPTEEGSCALPLCFSPGGAVAWRPKALTSLIVKMLVSGLEVEVASKERGTYGILASEIGFPSSTIVTSPASSSTISLR